MRLLAVLSASLGFDGRLAFCGAAHVPAGNFLFSPFANETLANRSFETE